MNWKKYKKGKFLGKNETRKDLDENLQNSGISTKLYVFLKNKKKLKILKIWKI